MAFCKRVLRLLQLGKMLVRLVWLIRLCIRGIASGWWESVRLLLLLLLLVTKRRLILLPLPRRGGDVETRDVVLKVLVRKVHVLPIVGLKRTSGLAFLLADLSKLVAR